MYSQPVGYVAFGVNLVVGAASGVIIGAPGAGFMLRIVGAHLTINRLSTGIVEVSLTATTSGNVIAFSKGMQLTGTSFSPISIPEPGLTLLENESLTLTTFSTAAAGAAYATVYYYVDQVS
jgi:hypothetical protein